MAHRVGLQRRAAFNSERTGPLLLIRERRLTDVVVLLVVRAPASCCFMRMPPIGSLLSKRGEAAEPVRDRALVMMQTEVRVKY
jgi:hypothetical protein